MRRPGRPFLCHRRVRNQPRTGPAHAPGGDADDEPPENGAARDRRDTGWPRAWLPDAAEAVPWTMESPAMQGNADEDRAAARCAWRLRRRWASAAPGRPQRRPACPQGCRARAEAQGRPCFAAALDQPSAQGSRAAGAGQQVAEDGAEAENDGDVAHEVADAE